MEQIGQAEVQLAQCHEMDELRDVARLLEAVWGRNAEGAPIPSEVLRAVVHAGGLVNVARNKHDVLLGAAVMTPTAAGGGYSMIAATAPGITDRGIGTMLKLHQRDWALAHGMTDIRWTFDPLVARNARFNLDKLGAQSNEYIEAFYGVMVDDLNAGDISDRLVVVWPLTEAQPSDTPLPVFIEVFAHGPDGEPAYAADHESLWCRVPQDIVQLRHSDPPVAQAWRDSVRSWLNDAFSRGHTATGMSRTSWYRLTCDDREEGNTP